MSNTVANEWKFSTIRITSIEDMVLCGDISNPALDSAKTFEGVMQMLFLIDRIADRIGFPQKVTDTRSFKKNSKEDPVIIDLDSVPDSDSSEPAIATFELNVQFRRRAGLQGRIRWIEKGESAEFISDLDLLKFISGCVGL